MTAPAAREIRARRPPVLRPTPSDPPIAETDLELEREPDGSQRPCSSVFLVGAECPFTCIFCDLWRNTLEVATPEGELPRQLRAALGALPADRLRGRIKLYNASNFFDPRAVPPGDLDEIAELVAPFERVVVECHARLVGDTCLDFAERLGGRLELALGLEVADDDGDVAQTGHVGSPVPVRPVCRRPGWYASRLQANRFAAQTLFCWWNGI